MDQQVRQMSNCKKCGLTIIWAINQNGHYEPKDPDGGEHWGTCKSYRNRGQVVTVQESFGTTQPNHSDPLWDGTGEPPF
jgi:hypothetical protein